MTISADIEDNAVAAFAGAPFDEGVAGLCQALLVPILFEPYAAEMALLADGFRPRCVTALGESRCANRAIPTIIIQFYNHS
ncbi:hypothetical protein [Rhizobium chutanense]|uniref:hypothetical protein n=1 Tax=Rhizobium chutanense TaxID=2035448 RepID=UPI0026AF6DE5